MGMLYLHNDILSHRTVVWLGYLVYCVFVCLYGYGFLSREKDSGVKLRVLVRLLSAMSFSPIW